MGAAMGIGRFAYTPILPLMTAQAAVTPQLAGNLATANYVGYLAGALAGTASRRLTRSAMALRTSLVVLVATLAAMPFAPNAIGWLGLRTVAGFTSAVVFVIAVNSMLDHLGDHSPHLPGWGFGGVRIGIALSGVLVLALPTAGWQSAWWIAAASAAVLSACAWTMRGIKSPAKASAAATAPPEPPGRFDRRFAMLFVSYTLEGTGTSSLAPSWWQPSNRPHRAGSATGPGCSSASPPPRRRGCGLGSVRAGRIRSCSRSR